VEPAQGTTPQRGNDHKGGLRRMYLGVGIEFRNFLTNASTRHRPRSKFLGKNEGPLATVVAGYAYMFGRGWNSPDGVPSNIRRVPVDHGMTAVSVSIPLAHHSQSILRVSSETWALFLAGCSGNPLCAIFSLFSGLNLHSRKMRHYR